MKLRLILLVLSLLAFLSASTGGYLYYSSIKESALKEAERQAVARVQTIGQKMLDIHLMVTRHSVFYSPFIALITEGFLEKVNLKEEYRLNL